MKESVKILLPAGGAAAGLLGGFICRGGARSAALCLAAACLALLVFKCAAYARDFEAILPPDGKKRTLHSAPGRALQSRIDEREARLKAEYSAAAGSRPRIDALQNQINPHFLYNTLECIRSEAILQGCGNIASMSHALASFFRYSISRRENIVTLRDELNNIRNYFLIQQFRFDERFFLEIETDEDDGDVQDCFLPKMTIQPIVENSIFHGLEPKTGQGHVRIQVRSTETLLQLIITDDGVGMDADALARLRAGMERSGPEKSGAEGHGNGIAMHNVNQRIKLIFGPQYGVQVYSAEGQGTQVELLLPAVRSREALRVTEDGLS